MKITVSGSIAFYTEMEALRDALALLGHDVKIPELSTEAPVEFGGGKKVYFRQYVEENGGVDSFPVGHPVWKLKEDAICDHFRKIEWCDAMLVANYEKRGIAGYIGGNTLIEIGLAYYLKKPLYILNPISSELSYKMEVQSMRPVMLDGDLKKMTW